MSIPTTTSAKRHELTVEELSSQFKKLKKTARNIDAFAKWFKKYPQVLPSLPIEYYSKIKLDVCNCGVNYHHYNNTVEMDIEVTCYVMQPKNQKGLTDFTKITGCTTSRGFNKDVEYEVNYHIQVSAMDCPFVAAYVLFYSNALTRDNPNYELTYLKIIASVFPNLTWPSLKALQENSFLPTDFDTFFTWITSLDQKQNKVITNTLPELSSTSP